MKIKQFNIKPIDEYINITDRIQRYIKKEKIKNALCMIYTKHTTACIRILEPEILLRQDMHDFMERLAPSTVLYRHDDLENRDVPPEERRNGYSHLRAMLLNYQEIVPIIDSKLDFGKWQQVFYIECDLGKEDRTFNICIFEEE